MAYGNTATIPNRPPTSSIQFFTGCPAVRKSDEIERQERVRQAQADAPGGMLNIEPMYFDQPDNFMPEARAERALSYAGDGSDRAGKLVLGSNGTGKTHHAVGIVRSSGDLLHV